MRNTGLLGAVYCVIGGLGLFGIACLSGNLACLGFAALFVSLGAVGVCRSEGR